MDTLTPWIAVIGAIAAFLNIMVTLIGGIIFAIRLEGKLNVQKVEIGALKQSNAALTTIVTNNAVQDEKIERMEREISDLRRGTGWITERRASVEGEYSR